MKLSKSFSRSGNGWCACGLESLGVDGGVIIMGGGVLASFRVSDQGNAVDNTGVDGVVRSGRQVCCVVSSCCSAVWVTSSAITISVGEGVIVVVMVVGEGGDEGNPSFTELCRTCTSFCVLLWECLWWECGCGSSDIGVCDC